MFEFFTDPINKMVSVVAGIGTFLAVLILVTIFIKFCRETGWLDEWRRIPAMFKSDDKSGAQPDRVTCTNGFAVKKNGQWILHKGLHLVANKYTDKVNMKLLVTSAIVSLCTKTCDAVYMSSVSKTVITNASGLSIFSLSWQRPELITMQGLYNGGLTLKHISGFEVELMTDPRSMLLNFKALETQSGCFNCSRLKTGFKFGILCCGDAYVEDTYIDVRINARCGFVSDHNRHDAHGPMRYGQVFQPCPTVIPFGLLFHTDKGLISVTTQNEAKMLIKASGLQVVVKREECEDVNCFFTPSVANVTRLTLSDSGRLHGNQSIFQIVQQTTQLNRVKRTTCTGYAVGWLYNYASVECDDQKMARNVLPLVAAELSPIFGQINSSIQKVIDWTDENIAQIVKGQNTMMEHLKDITNTINTVKDDQGAAFFTVQQLWHQTVVLNNWNAFGASILSSSEELRELKDQIQSHFLIEAQLLAEKDKCVGQGECVFAQQFLSSKFHDLNSLLESGWDDRISVSYGLESINMSIIVPETFKFKQVFVPIMPRVDLKNSCYKGICQCCMNQPLTTYTPDYSFGSVVNVTMNTSIDVVDKSDVSPCAGEKLQSQVIESPNNCVIMTLTDKCDITFDPCFHVKTSSKISVNVTFDNHVLPEVDYIRLVELENNSIFINITPISAWKIRTEVSTSLMSAMQKLNSLTISEKHSSQAVSSLHWLSMMNSSAILVFIIIGLVTLFLKVKKRKQPTAVYRWESGVLIPTSISIEHFRWEYEIRYTGLSFNACLFDGDTPDELLEELGMEGVFLVKKKCLCEKIWFAEISEMPNRDSPVTLHSESAKYVVNLDKSLSDDDETVQLTP